MEETEIQTYFEEHKHFLSQLESLWRSRKLVVTQESLEWPRDEMQQIDKLLSIIDKYQENPQLLDPHLEDIIRPLVGQLLTEILETTGSMSSTAVMLEQSHPFFMVLYRLVKSRGYKTVLRYFTHEASHLEPLLLFLQSIQQSSKYWETRYILLLWLSLVSMVPFDLTRVESNEQLSLVQRLLMAAEAFVGAVGKEYEGASILLMRLLTRKDASQSHLLPFVEKTFDSLLQPSLSMFQVRGLLASLAAIFKYGPRQTLAGCVAKAAVCHRLISDNKNIGLNSLLRKQVVKLAQRIVLCSLKPRVASWRYQRGARSLADTLSTHIPSSSALSYSSLTATATADKSCGGMAMQDSIEFDIVPDELEGVVDLLLTGLSDKDTIVRWTSAKGIGRIANRLDREMADDIVASVIATLTEDVFELPTTGEVSIDGVSDAAWHGACLALAELARRGLLLEVRLHQCLPWVMRALTFDQKKGMHSIGSHVRDAACYVCWSFARAYSPQAMAPFALQLAQRLVVACVTDREVNIRRAAAAAFQENVGRHGLFPDGISIIGFADYFTLSNRNFTFMSIVPQAIQSPSYAIPIIDCLRSTCRCHWDRSIRALSASSIGIVASQPVHSDYIQSTILPVVINQSADQDLEVRHGSLLMLSETLIGLHKPDSAWPDAFVSSVLVPVFQLVHKVYPAYTESFGSEMTRSGLCLTLNAICRTSSLTQIHAFIDSLGPVESKVLFSETAECWIKFLDSCLERPEEQLQSDASQTASLFTAHKLIGVSKDKLSQYVAGVTQLGDKNRRRGYCVMLGFASSGVVKEFGYDVVRALCNATCITSEAIHNDAETRRNAVHGLTRIVQTLSSAKALGEFVCGVGGLEAFMGLCDAVLKGMEDYSTDSRGDVGSWVRDASTQCLRVLLPIVAEKQGFTATQREIVDSVVDAAYIRKAIGAIVLQSVEKIDRLRESAGTALVELVFDRNVEMTGKKELQLILASGSNTEEGDGTGIYMNWLDPKEIYPVMIKIMGVEAYRQQVLTGLIVSMGGLTESLVKHSSATFIDFIKSLPTHKTDLNEQITRVTVLESLLDVFEAYKEDDRVVVPVLDVYDLVISLDVIEWKQIDGKHLDTAKYVSSVYKLLKGTIHKTKNVKKLSSALKVMSAVVGVSSMDYEGFESVYRESLYDLVGYLGHAYPRVRHMASEILYVLVSTTLNALAGSQHVKYSIDDLGQVEQVLVCTDWDLKGSHIKQGKQEIESILF